MSVLQKETNVCFLRLCRSGLTLIVNMYHVSCIMQLGGHVTIKGGRRQY